MATPQVKFVVYHTARTGSTMLSSALSEHSQVHGEKEIFHQRFYKYEGASYSKYKTAKDYIEKEFYPKLKSHHKAFGFKLQSYQAMKERHPDPEGELIDLRDYLIENDYRFIVIYRLNKLDQFVSQLYAHTNDHWHRYIEDDKSEPPRIELKEKMVVERKRFANWYYWNREQEDIIYRDLKKINHENVMKVVYEDLTLDWSRYMDYICDWLDIDREVIRPTTWKSRDVPVSDWIENYDELIEIHDEICSPHEVYYRIKNEKGSGADSPLEVRPL